MPTTTYATLDGVILSEDRNGTQRNYVPDTLGNTTMLTDSTGVTDTFEYWPYGEIRTRTGTNATNFQYVGTLGYCKVPQTALTYVRARMYMASRGRWTSVDPLWPTEDAFKYVSGNPVSLVDIVGERPSSLGFFGCRVNKRPSYPPPPSLLNLPGFPGSGASCESLNKYVYDFCSMCRSGIPRIDPRLWTCEFTCNQLADWYYHSCKDSTSCGHLTFDWLPCFRGICPFPTVCLDKKRPFDRDEWEKAHQRCLDRARNSFERKLCDMILWGPSIDFMIGHSGDV